MSLKAYFKGNELEKTATLITLKGQIIEGDRLIFLSGRSEPFIFKRFTMPGEPNKSWYNSANGGDGHAVTAKQDVLFGGFGVFFSSEGEPFECKYILKIKDKVVHNNEILIKCDKPVDKYFFRYLFDEPYFIAAGEKFDLSV